MRYNLDEIRNQVSLAALAEEAGARFDNPHRLSSHCPLPRHAGDRSSLAFTVFDNGRKWKCHSSCPSDANGGDVFAFYMAWKGVDFKTAVAELAERTRLPILPEPVIRRQPMLPPELQAPNSQWRERAKFWIAQFEHNLVGSSGARAREYLESERGLSPETWQAFHLGYNPVHRYEPAAAWGLDGRKIWLPRGIVVPGFWQGQPWYIKVRRPLAGDVLGHYIGEWSNRDGLPEVKFGGPRGGRLRLYSLDQTEAMPVLFLVEGEWDVMLVWQACRDLCAVSTLGGARAKFDSLDLALLTRYLAVLVTYDDDRAGDEGRRYIAELHSWCSRILPIAPPAHDITDFWRAGGDVRAWVAKYVTKTLDEALGGMEPDSPVVAKWRQMANRARGIPS